MQDELTALNECEACVIIHDMILLCPKHNTPEIIAAIRQWVFTPLPPNMDANAVHGMN